eukprot:SAG31_NODE_269_length_18741_cov_11.185441_4_plen_65_part_00
MHWREDAHIAVVGDERGDGDGEARGVVEEYGPSLLHKVDVGDNSQSQQQKRAGTRRQTRTLQGK